MYTRYLVQSSHLVKDNCGGDDDGSGGDYDNDDNKDSVLDIKMFFILDFLSNLTRIFSR